MNRPEIWLASALFIFSSGAFAKDPPPPCRTRSRQMTLVKNCYTGDMGRPLEGGAQFFDSAASASEGVSYCYNSLVLVDHRPGEALVHIHVMKDGKDGQFHAYNYALAPDEMKKLKKDTPLLTLKGIKGECFSPKGDKEACAGGVLNMIGLKDTDVPMVVAIGKATNGQFTVSHLIHERKELAARKPKELELTATEDVNRVTEKLLQEIRRKLATAAAAKMATLHSGTMTPKKMVDTSEQFRFCSMAIEGYLKDKKLADPFSPQEKMTLATVTNYMNNDTAAPQTSLRLPASVKPTPAKK